MDWLHSRITGFGAAHPHAAGDLCINQSFPGHARFIVPARFPSCSRQQPPRLFNGALKLRVGAGRIRQRERHGNVGRDAHALQPPALDGNIRHGDIKQAAIGQQKGRTARHRAGGVGADQRPVVPVFDGVGEQFGAAGV